jgi:hypothetical protein
MESDIPGAYTGQYLQRKEVGKRPLDRIMEVKA